MKFDIFTTIPLDFVNENWKDCYLKFSYITADELKDFAGTSIDKDDKKSTNDASDKTFKMLEDKFVEGKALVGGSVVDVTKENIRDFPINILKYCIENLMSVDEDKKKD